MFYVKTELTEGVTLKTEITSENVFTECPNCGKELNADLVDILGDGNGDLESTKLYCCECSEKLTDSLRKEPNFLCAIDPESGASVHLDTAHFVIDCCDCDAPHPIDLNEIISTLGDNFTSLEDIRVRCDDCTAKRTEERAD
jgi:hypothetical protein